MLVGFFQELRRCKVPVTLREFLDLMGALQNKVAFSDMQDFYYLSRICMVKDEKYFDRYDLAFSAYFKGLENIENFIEALIPDEWLRREFEKQLTDEEKARIKSLGGLEQLLEEFKKRLEEQNERHQGGSKWIGTGGTSPYGAYGYNPEGIRIGQDGNRNNRAVKVWDKREFKNLDDSVELGTRNIKVALRRLREFARTGAREELDMDATIRGTAKNAGYLDLHMIPERHNAVKVLLFIDVGGSMSSHVKTCEELFSATRTEFKHLEYFYFHNFIYESVWKDNHRRWSERIQTLDVLHKYSSDYKVIFVGDAAMSPYEITHVGGSVEHWNPEAGVNWMKRLTDVYGKVIWLNPEHAKYWGSTPSIGIIQRLLEGRMYPLTLEGLDAGMKCLNK